MSHVRKAAGSALLAAATTASILVPLATPSASAASAPTGFSVDQPGLSPGGPQGVELSWSPVDGATGYDVRLSSSADWSDTSSITLPGAHTTAPVYAPPPDLPHATYYWQVRADFSSGAGAWTSAPQPFTRAWLDQPIGLTSKSAKWVDLTWAPMADASYYEIDISNDPSFQDPFPVQGSNVANPPTDGVRCYTAHPEWIPYVDKVGKSGIDVDCEPNTFALKYGQTYYWRVRGRNGTGVPAGTYNTAGDAVCTGVWHSYNVTSTSSKAECSLWSDDGSFTVSGNTTQADVMNTQPTGLTTDCLSPCPDTPALSWTDMPGADFYRVTIARDKAMTNITHIFDVNGNKLREATAEPDQQQTLYWTVQSCARTPTTTATALKVTPNQDGTVTLDATVSPPEANGKVSFYDGTTLLPNGANLPLDFTNNALLSFTPAAGTTYHFVATFAPSVGGYSSATSNIVTYDGTTTTSTAIPAVAQSHYDCGVAATPKTFPWKQSQPVQNSPVSAAAADQLYPTLSWLHYSAVDPMTEARGYRVQVATSADFSQPLVDTTTDLTAYTAQQTLPTGTLWWRVAAIDEMGNQLAWSAPGSFIRPTSAVAPGTSVDSASTLLGQRWEMQQTTAALDGWYAVSAFPNDRMSFSFSGPMVRLYGTRMPAGGYADVYIDGVRKATVNFYSSSVRYRQMVYGTTIASGSHVLTVIVRGSHQTGATGSKVAIDALATSTATIEESSAVMLWSTHRATDAYDGSYAAEAYPLADRGSRPRASARLVGSIFTVYGCKSPRSGKMYVFVDSKLLGTADLYQSYSACNRAVFRTPVLAAGVHTVTVEPVGLARTGSLGTEVSVDRITGQ